MSYHPFQGHERPLNFISLHLRNHPIWASAVNQLRASNPRQWREATLPLHCGISISIFDEDIERFSIFDVLLLTAADIPCPLPSVANQLAVVYLLDSSFSDPATSLRGFMALQVQFPDSPILPITTPSALQETLQSFTSSLLRSSQQYLPVIDVVTELIPYCNLRPGGARLSRRTVERITEEAGSLRDVLFLMTMIDDREREFRIRENPEWRSWSYFWNEEIDCDDD